MRISSFSSEDEAKRLEWDEFWQNAGAGSGWLWDWGLLSCPSLVSLRFVVIISSSGLGVGGGTFSIPGEDIWSGPQSLWPTKPNFGYHFDYSQ